MNFPAKFCNKRPRPASFLSPELVARFVVCAADSRHRVCDIVLEAARGLLW